MTRDVFFYTYTYTHKQKRTTNSGKLLRVFSKQTNKHTRTYSSGDSGGPLVRYGGADPILVGITSFGVRCGNPKFPSVFTRISGMVGWLKTTGAVFYTKKGVENGKSGLQCAAGEFVFEYRSGVEFCRPCPERSASRGGRVRTCELCERGMMRSSYNGAKCSCKGALAVGRGFVRGWCRRCGPGSFAAAADETCRMCAKGTVARGYGNGMCRAV